MTLELDTVTITECLKAFVRELGLPIDWEAGVTYYAFDGPDDPEPLVVTDLRAHLTIPHLKETTDA